MSYRGKVIFLGDAGVGKTSLIARYCDNIFRDNYSPTVGANFLIKEIELEKILDRIDDSDLVEDIKDKGFKLYFWDIGGQHDKLFANEYFFIQAVGAMVIFNVEKEETFKNLEFWISKMKQLSGDIPFIIVGNKTDLDRRVIDNKTLKKKADSFGVEYVETSAKLDENVNKAFEILSVKILNRILNHFNSS